MQPVTVILNGSHTYAELVFNITTYMERKLKPPTSHTFFVSCYVCSSEINAFQTLQPLLAAVVILVGLANLILNQCSKLIFSYI